MKMLNTNLLIGGLFAIFAAVNSHASTIWDAADDFSSSTSTNPNGVWNYGYDPASLSGYQFKLFDNFTPDQPPLWNDSTYSLGRAPAFLKNESGSEIYGIAPGQISLHPGPAANGDAAILRFVAPYSGRYDINAQFFDGDIGETDAWIVLNNDFAAPQASLGITSIEPVYSVANLMLSAGDSLDFVVGNHGLYSSDNTPLDLQISTAVPNLNITTPNLDFGNILVGDSGARSLTISNSGEANSLLHGTIGGASGEFTPGGAQGFSSLEAGDTLNRGYTYTPANRGSDVGNVAVTSEAGSGSVALSGTGVAPVNQVSGDGNAGYVRIGTSDSVSATVQNVGDGNLSGQGATSNLLGSVASASGEFAGGGQAISLTDGLSVDLSFDYTPADHGADSQAVNLNFSNGSSDGSNASQVVALDLSGTGVGPVFNSSIGPGATIDFGEIFGLTGVELTLDISNIETDLALGDNLQGLTLVNAYITGGEADLFSLTGFTAGTVLSAGATESQTLTIRYDPTGNFTLDEATLVIVTDVNAAFGESGDSFTFGLQGQGGIPAPASLMLVLPGLLGVVGLRRRTRQRKLA